MKTMLDVIAQREQLIQLLVGLDFGFDVVPTRGQMPAWLPGELARRYAARDGGTFMGWLEAIHSEVEWQSREEPEAG